jgi:hypothetical protein
MATPGGDMGRIAVEDIRKGHLDESDQKILTVYYRSGSRYAIYRTPERVALQYSDSQNEQKEQRKRLATLGPIRGEINGLIDGWRNLADKTFEQPDDVPLTGKTGRNASKVNRYDRRVADALLIALEGEDGPGALALLDQIKTDLIEERKSWARVLYVLYAAAAVGTIAVLSAAISWLFLAKSCMPNGLWLGLASGALGAFFSIAQAIRSRSVLTDLQMSGNIADAILRILVGSISAVVLIGLLLSQLIGIQINGTNFGLGDPSAGCMFGIWNIKIMLAGFVAGFLERLVPDLLQKASAAEAKDAPTIILPPAPPKPTPLPAPVAPPAAGPDDASDAAAQPAATAEGSPPDDAEQVPETEENCLTHAPVTDDEATPDDQLPPATGGVEKS